jgi:1-phosphofructokinase
MIATCTLNPSLDYYMEFDSSLKTGKTHRSQLEYYEAGGKGINASIVLNNLGIPTRAFGFVGGFTKDFYISLLAKYEEIRPNFTYIDGHTRINVKCSADGETVDFNATGPYITNDDMKNLAGKVKTLYEGDYFVLAGNTPEYLENDVVEMLKQSIQDGIRIVVDTNPSIDQKILPSKPFMIKTTPAELAKIVGHEVKDRNEAVSSAKEVHDAGARYVMVLLNNTEAILVCKEGVYDASLSRDEKAVSFVGTGDSLIAGFLMNYLRTKDPLDSFRFGASCGSATAYSKGLATREKIDSFYETTEVRKIG